MLSVTCGGTGPHDGDESPPMGSGQVIMVERERERLRQEVSSDLQGQNKEIRKMRRGKEKKESRKD